VRRVIVQAVLVDDFLPTYDVSDSVAAQVDADVPTTWTALSEVDLIQLGRDRPLVGVLGALRMLPEVVTRLVHGEKPQGAPERLTLRDTASTAVGWWTLLGERPDDEIALGLVGKFWRPVIEYAEVAADEFRDFAEPGFAKTIYSLAVRPLDDGRTVLTATMRTATTDEHARRWFHRYWTFGVGSGAHVLAAALVDSARERAEGASGA
jgi:hypothetical protein